MPRGISRIKQLHEESAKRQAEFESGTGFHRALIMKGNDTAQVRFLEQGVGLWFVYTHKLPLKPGQQYADSILCADQALSDAEAETYVEGSRPCYACQLDGVPRSARVIVNLIRYDEPRIQRDEAGKALRDAANQIMFDGIEPALLIWETSQTVGNRLAYLESRHGPLTNHIFTIHRTGDKNNMWMIDIAELNKTPPSPEEVALAEKKIDPPLAIQKASPKFKALPLLSYGDMRNRYSGAGSSPTSFVATGAGAPAPAPTGNVYADAAARMNLGAFDPSNS
jgi:hypothetical protein